MVQAQVMDLKQLQHIRKIDGKLACFDAQNIFFLLQILPSCKHAFEVDLHTLLCPKPNEI
jgi:hypothetical protein